MSKLRQIVILTLSLILILSVSIRPQYSVYAAELTNDTIRAKEAEVKAAQEEKAKLQSAKSDVEAIKKSLEKSKNDLNAYITELDAKLSEIQQKINELTEQIATKEEEITVKEKELDEALAVQQNQYNAMKKRIKFMYERGNTMYVDLLINAGGFSDALNKAEYIESLSAYDRRKLNEYIEYSEYVSACKDALEAEREVLAEAKSSQEDEEKSLNELVAEKEKEIAAVSADISQQNAAINDYEAEIQAQNDAIRVLEAAIAEEKKKLESERQRYDGGKFCNPCPSYIRISDDYGERINPVTHQAQFHKGIDMAAKGGSPILAAYSGTVAAAGYSSSMGNYVMINHGDGLYTIYMHASALYVSKGQSVSRGETIAAVGSTGRSTGNHLHFAVRLNGDYVSPWGYLSN